ncbi:hypothetical protein EI94DRAFT_1784487 [Lactarius quietus]|nr:hypothetical protein EI94DRAFT_1784487 [Lactarius quietus]
MPDEAKEQRLPVSKIAKVDVIISRTGEDYLRVPYAVFAQNATGEGDTAVRGIYNARFGHMWADAANAGQPLLPSFHASLLHTTGRELEKPSLLDQNIGAPFLYPIALSKNAMIWMPHDYLIYFVSIGKCSGRSGPVIRRERPNTPLLLVRREPTKDHDEVEGHVTINACQPCAPHAARSADLELEPPDTRDATLTPQVAQRSINRYTDPYTSLGNDIQVIENEDNTIGECRHAVQNNEQAMRVATSSMIPKKLSLRGRSAIFIRGCRVTGDALR